MPKPTEPRLSHLILDARHSLILSSMLATLTLSLMTSFLILSNLSPHIQRNKKYFFSITSIFIFVKAQIAFILIFVKTLIITLEQIFRKNNLRFRVLTSLNFRFLLHLGPSETSSRLFEEMVRTSRLSRPCLDGIYWVVVVVIVINII